MQNKWEETGESVDQEDAADRIESDISDSPTVQASRYDAPFALRDGRRAV
jgi:hypothetical protein